MAPKPQWRSARLSGDKERERGFFRSAANGIMFVSLPKSHAMKPSLHLKVAVVLAYVALCTMLVLADQQAEAPTQNGQQPTASNYE